MKRETESVDKKQTHLPEDCWKYFGANIKNAEHFATNAVGAICHVDFKYVALIHWSASNANELFRI